MIPLRPFLKWAGAKTKLVNAIRDKVPLNTKRFIEPFAGSGAVALNLNRSQKSLTKIILADSNHDLISVYRELKRDGRGFISECAELFTKKNNSEKAFYALRDEFNSTSNRRRKACLFVYLNRHDYNGLCRYNASGQFNVPFGRYKLPYFPQREMESFRRLLRRCKISRSDFRDILRKAGKNDFVYCDPPYSPASTTANFTAYSKAAFGQAEQRELVELCLEARSRGAVILLSNHDTAETRKLYESADERYRLMVSRHISCNGDNRIKVRELLVIFRPRD